MTLKNTRVKKAGVRVGETDSVNFIDGANTTITVVKDTDNDEMDITIASSGGGGGGTPSDTVASETAFGVASAAGAATDYSRGDHTHGSPTNPITAHEAAADPHTGYVREADANWIDLTDAGETALHTHAGGGGGAPTDADYLVGTANGGLSAEIVVGTTPGGELGGTWGSPTVDATHSGSAHHAQSHGNADHTSTFITATGVTFENLDANADVGTGAAQVAQGNHAHAGSGHVIQDDDVNMTARANLSFQDGFVLADDAGGDQTEIDVSYAATPSTQAFGDAAAAGTAITVTRGDHKHAMPANPVTAHEAAGDPHTGYRLESADHSHASTGLQAGTIDHGVITGLTDDDHTQYRLESVDHTHQTAGAEAGKLDHGLALNGLTDDDHTQYRLESEDIQSITFTKTGNLATGTGTTRWYNDTGRSLTLQSARGSVGTAPATQSILVDVNNNGTSVWATNQANRITIAAAGNTDEGGAFDDSTIADGEYITVDIDQVGSGTVGADLTVTIWYIS